MNSASNARAIKNAIKVAAKAVRDGVTREIDLAPYLRGPIFDPVRSNPAVFRAVRVEGGTVAWENGADIDPDVLYYDLKPVWMEGETLRSA